VVAGGVERPEHEAVVAGREVGIGLRRLARQEPLSPEGPSSRHSNAASGSLGENASVVASTCDAATGAGAMAVYDGPRGRVVTDGAAGWWR
jgi:hypothetical protein